MQRIGERLEEARKKKGISIREAAEATKIRGDYLQKFESNHFDIGLTEIYTRGFLRNYANFLKLPADRILNDYAALGRGDVRPRQPSREVYGRMDISVATGEAGDRAATGDDAAAGGTAPGGAPQPRYPRGSGPTLPGGPDPALVFRYLKFAGIAAVILLLAVVIRALLLGGSDGESTAPRTTPSPNSAVTPADAQPASGLTYRLVANDTVQVRIARRLGPEQNAPEGEDLFNGVLRRGDSRTIPLNGPQTLYFSAGENLSMEWNGRLIKIPLRGAGSVPVDIPPSAR